MDRDRVREIERRVYELEDITARLPVTFPTNVSQPLTLYLGQPLSNVTPSTDVFTLTNLTRFPSGEAPEQIDVKNTQNLEVGSGEKVVYAVEVIVDGEIEYETWGPGSGGGGGTPSTPGTVPFQLTSDKPNTLPHASAVLIDINGDPIPGGEITVADKTTQAPFRNPAGRFGLATYVDATGNPQFAYRGECRSLDVANYKGTGLPGFEIVSMEGPADEVLVEMLEEGPSGSGEITVDVKLIKPLGSNEAARMPKGIQISGTSGGPGDYKMAIVDTQQIVTGLRVGALLTAKRDHAMGIYRAASADPIGYLEYDSVLDLQAFVHVNGVKQWATPKLISLIMEP